MFLDTYKNHLDFMFTVFLVSIHAQIFHQSVNCYLFMSITIFSSAVNNKKCKTESNNLLDTKIHETWDFTGGTVVGTRRSQCRGPRFDPWPGN